jgi:hypothetical protein
MTDKSKNYSYDSIDNFNLDLDDDASPGLRLKP